MNCPTVKIRSDKQESGFLIINESDFDPKAMELYVEADDLPKVPLMKRKPRAAK